MEAPQLPPELERLECELAARPRAPASAELRQRVLRDVQAELGEAGPPPARLPSSRANGWWTFAAATAAGVLFWVNLSWSAAHAGAYDLRLSHETRPIGAVAEEIRELLPGISHRDALRHAVTLQAGSELIRCPSVSADSPMRDHLNALYAILLEGE